MKRFPFASARAGIVLHGWFAALGLTLFLTGCGRQSVTVYTVPKEPRIASPPTPSPHHGPQRPAGSPAISWSTPEGWEELPASQMRAASFRVADHGKTVDIAIVPLPGLAGKDIDNVNRWRAQVGAAPITEAEMEKMGQPVTIADSRALLFEQAGTDPTSGQRARILAAILRKDGTAWFFKATGDDELTTKTKAAFIQFLKTIQFNQPSK